MIIAATSDVHSPRRFGDFLSALDGMDSLETKPHLFLIAGDMVHSGEVGEYERVCNAMFGKITCPIVACFGNNEYTEKRDELKQSFRNIRFLDDQSIAVGVRVPAIDRLTGQKVERELSVGIVGTTGSLETPTPWQRANVPNIARTYEGRISMVERHLNNMRTDFKIVLMHYAPTYKTLEGENPRFYSSLGWNVYENVLIRQKPNLVVHGHSHHGSKQAWVDSVPVFNVSLQVNGKIVIIDTEGVKPGLTKFV
jgi:Icc-related predicted phosphoesterase